MVLMILFAMLWQTTAAACASFSSTANQQHAALHWQDKSHHHHEDGSFHLDDSRASVQHGLTDHVHATVALVAEHPNDFPFLGSTTPSGLHEAIVPNPPVDGLLRPPRLGS